MRRYLSTVYFQWYVAVKRVAQARYRNSDNACSPGTAHQFQMNGGRLLRRRHRTESYIASIDALIITDLNLDS